MQANVRLIDTHSPRPVPATAITDPEWIRAQLTAAGRRYRLDRRPTIGVLWWYSASSVLLGPPVESLVRTGAAADPSLSAMTLLVEPDGRMLDARSDSVLCRDKLGTALAETLGGCVAAVSGASGAPGRALWAIATDSLANRLLALGRAMGDERRVTALAAPLAAAVGPPLPAPRYVDVAGARFTRRVSCCLLYRLPPEPLCTSCPRRPAAERELLLEDTAARMR
jgi:ferric iron reductase protein FhuF